MKDDLAVDQMELSYPIRIHIFPDKHSNQTLCLVCLPKLLVMSL